MGDFPRFFVEACAQAFNALGPYAAALILAVWLVAAVGGTMKSERSWIDRAGRALGMFWIVSALAFKFLTGRIETDVDDTSVTDGPTVAARLTGQGG